MKSKLFGFNAKLALALLAISGAMFTSCYESDKEDVYIPKPTELPDAVYTITGTVTDADSNLPIVGVSITGISTNAIITPAAGDFRVNVSAGTYTIKFTKADYAEVTRELKIEEAAKGSGNILYPVNVVLSKTIFEDANVRVDPSNPDSQQEVKPFPVTENPALDLVNTTAQPIIVTKYFEVLSGAEAEQIITRADIEAPTLKEYAEQYIKQQIGDFSKGIVKDTIGFEITIPAYSSVVGANLTSNMTEQTFNFSRGEEKISYKTKRVGKYTLTPNTLPNSSYIGHGHGHGDDPNAGGGILNPLN